MAKIASALVGGVGLAGLFAGCTEPVEPDDSDTTPPQLTLVFRNGPAPTLKQVDQDGQASRANAISLAAPLVMQGLVNDKGGVRGGQIVTKWKWTCLDGTEGDQNTSANVDAPGPDANGNVPRTVLVDEEITLKNDLQVQCADQQTLKSLSGSVTLTGQNWVKQDASLTSYFRYYPPPEFQFAPIDDEPFGTTEQAMTTCMRVNGLNSPCVDPVWEAFKAVINSGWLLNVQDGAVDPAVPRAGQPFDFVYKLNNDGMSESPEFTITWTIEGNGTRHVERTTWPGILAHSFNFGTLKFPRAVPGTWKLSSIIEPANRLGSPVRQYSTTFTIPP